MKQEIESMDLQRHIAVNVLRALRPLIMHGLVQVLEGSAFFQCNSSAVDLFIRLGDLLDRSTASDN